MNIGSAIICTSGWDRTQLLGASSNDLLQVLASKLLHNQSHLFAISLNSDRAERNPCNTVTFDLVLDRPQNLLDVGFVDILSSKGS